MKYSEIRFKINPEGGEGEMLAALLAEIGYEGLVEENDTLTAYIDEHEYNEGLLKETLVLYGINLPFEKNTLQEQNWNEVWESQFQPVMISNLIYVRAPFHPPRPDLEYELIIEPRMSFGTAHHETTSLMLEYMLEFPLRNRSLLDMGCGTGILAIMAAKLGAAPIVAIDNDDWAVSNAKDNILMNNTPAINVQKGDAKTLSGLKPFDYILANINRNILLHDMKDYIRVLIPGGILLLSGFYSNDLLVIEQAASQLGLSKLSFKEKNNWVAAAFKNNP